MIAALAHRFGFVSVRKGRGVLLIAGPGDDLEGLVAAFAARFPRLRLHLHRPGRPGSPPGAHALAALPRTPRACRRLLTRTRAHALVVGAAAPGAPALVDAARASGVVSVLVAAQGRADARDHDFAILPAGAGAAPRTRRVDAADADASGQLLDLLGPHLRRAQRQGKQRRLHERVGRWLVLDSPLAAHFRRRFRALGTLEALRHALGDPGTILCLGNGPSSEDPAVRAARFDALFRVNHAWAPRGLHTAPNCVFTGLRATVAALRSEVLRREVLFVFTAERDAQDLRYRCATLPGPIRYATAEALGVHRPIAGGDGAPDGGVFRPSNGAIMIAVAVALQPERLLISGIDFFSHPAGAYPGDRSTPNAYTIAHDRESELAFMLAALDRYEGELVILNEVLRAARARHRGERPAPVHVTAPRAEEGT